LHYERMGVKLATKFVDSLDRAKKEATLQRLLCALGIRHVGEQTAKTLAATYADMDVLRAASPEELQNLPDIGPEVASSIKAFFEPNVALLARLRELGLWPVRQEAAVASMPVGPLAGQKILFTGSLSIPRSKAQQMAENAGAEIAGSVSRRLNLLVVGLGSLFGLFMKLLMPQKRSKDNKLIISVALLFAFCGVCALLDLSPLLGCMMMGTVYTNIADDDKLFKQLNYFSPPILLLFFVRSGMSFQLDALVSSSGNLDGVPLLVIGVSYFLVRILGKYAGAWLGCRLVKKDRLVRNYLGLALIPQAGVAIGLAALGARTLGGTMGSDLQTIILASSVLYELIGPGCAKLALYLSKSYSTKLEDVAVVAEVTETGEQKSDVQLLIERIRKIQSELPPLESDVSEEEAAFTEAAEEQLAQTQAQRRYFYLRR